MLVMCLMAGGLHAAAQVDGWGAFEEPHRMVLGNDARIDDWPGMSSLQIYQGRNVYHSCGATLIAAEWALTAAHCVEGVQIEDGARAVQYFPDEAGRSLVRFGPVQLAAHVDYLGDVPAASEFSISEIIVHPDYDPAHIEYGNDLALLRLDRPWSGPVMLLDGLSAEVDPGNLTPHNTRAQHRLRVEAAGFGKIGEEAPDESELARGGDLVSAPSLVLLEGRMPLIDVYQCTDFLRDRIVQWQMDGMDPELILDEETQLCAGIGEVDACQGDSGGPMIVRGYDGRAIQVGIISWGIGCGREESPGVYVRTSAYGDWIGSVIGMAPDDPRSVEPDPTDGD